MFLTTKMYRALESKLAAVEAAQREDAAAATLAEKRHMEVALTKIAIAAERDALRAELERRELEYERLRQDFNAVVTMIGNQASRPANRVLTDDDIFREQSDVLNTYLSPAPDEYVSGEEILNTLGDEDR